MIDSGPSFAEKPALTKVEAHQAQSRTSSLNDEKIRIEFFQQNPQIRKDLIVEPFSDLSRKSVEKVPCSKNAYAVLRSAILSEPDGTYEQTFNKLPRTEQSQKLYDQIDSSAEITIRIQKYIEDNLFGIDKIPDKDLYKVLCQVAFTTADETEIQTKYALSQRRGFRLSIANFLEDRNKLSVYRLESSTDPKAFARKYLKQKFAGNISIEQLQTGFIIYLDGKDYALIDSDDKKNPKSISSSGCTLFYRYWLPQELQGKIILLNRGGKETGIKTSEELTKTRNHEIRHLVFMEFHDQQNLMVFDAKDALTKCKTEQDYQRVSEMIYEYFVEGAKDEIIAYFSNGQLNGNYSALRFNQYQMSIKKAEKALNKRKDMSAETKIKILETFINNQKKCFETIRRMRFVTERMDEQSKQGLLDHDKAEALLRNTPGVKIHRLAKYTGLTADEIKCDRAIKENDRQIIDGLKSSLTIPENSDENWRIMTLHTLGQIKQQMPIEALPILLSAISKWSQYRWGSLMTEKAILLTKAYVEMNFVSEANKQNIMQIMNNVISQKTEMRDSYESVKFAKETLDLLKRNYTGAKS